MQVALHHIRCFKCNHLSSLHPPPPAFNHCFWWAQLRVHFSPSSLFPPPFLLPFSQCFPSCAPGDLLFLTEVKLAIYSHTHTHTQRQFSWGGGGEDALKAWLVSSSSSSSSPFVSVFSFHLRAPAPGATYWAGDRPAAILPVLTCVCLSVFVIWVLFEAFKWGCGSWGWVRQWYKATVARKCLCGCGSTLQPKRFSS